MAKKSALAVNVVETFPRSFLTFAMAKKSALTVNVVNTFPRSLRRLLSLEAKSALTVKVDETVARLRGVFTPLKPRLSSSRYIGIVSRDTFTEVPVTGGVGEGSTVSSTPLVRFLNMSGRLFSTISAIKVRVPLLEGGRGGLTLGRMGDSSMLIFNDIEFITLRTL